VAPVLPSACHRLGCGFVAPGGGLIRRVALAAAVAASTSALLLGGSAHAIRGASVLAVAPNGSDSAPCTVSAPCASFDRAYRVASPGAVVQVAPGSYPQQTIQGDPTKDDATADVVFRPTSGHVQVQDELRIEGAHVELQSMSSPDFYVAQTAHDVVIRDFTVNVFYITGANNVSVIGGSVGPYANGASEVKACQNCPSPPHGILIDGVTFHDYMRTNSNHVECLHVYPAASMTVRNSRFIRCAVIDLGFFQYGAAGASHDITIENNFFDHPTAGGSYAVEIDSSMHRPIEHVHFLHNSALATMWVDTSGGLDDVVFDSNVGPRASYHCYKGVTFRYDVWQGAACSASDHNAAAGFVNPSADDLHLAPGAPALNAADPGVGPSRDIDGDLRPIRMPSDAGADQRETAEIVLGRSIGRVHLGEPRAAVVAFYGRPGSVSHARGLEADTYRIHRARLTISYAGDAVVGVSTSSLYYTTAGGLGPGAPARSAPGRWSSCARAYVSSARGARTLAVPAGGRRAATIAAISIVRTRFSRTC
jgi:hypothetical protein